MGIPGLSNFINNKGYKLKDYKLHNTNLVIDGNNIALQLYYVDCKKKCNDRYGGDYDIYADVVKQFFQLLKECEVTPYVIFDGGTKIKKNRQMNHKIKQINDIERLCLKQDVSVYPYMLSVTFLNVLEELKINKIRCKFEADKEMASLSKVLDCPLLSCDSDFYIFDIRFIQFQHFKRELQYNGNKMYNHVNCKIWNVDDSTCSKFFYEINKNRLPLAAAIIGNDFFEGCEFTEKKSQEEKIEYVMKSLAKENDKTINSAAETILSRCKGERSLLIKRINTNIKYYSLCDSELIKYLNLSPVKQIYQNPVELITETYSNEEKNDYLGEEKNEDFDEQILENLPDSFFENYRKCIYPRYFMNLVMYKQHCFRVQVEDISMQHSHIHSENIMTCIYKILRGSTEDLKYEVRIGNNYTLIDAIPHSNVDLPSLKKIENMSENARQNLLLKIIDIDCSFLENTLHKFPKHWHLFVITVEYFYSCLKLDKFYLYSLILCAIVLNYVDSHTRFVEKEKIYITGLVRTKEDFKKGFGEVLPELVSSNTINLSQTIGEAIQKIDKNDSILCMDNLITYFKVNWKTPYNKQIIHKLAEFQSFIVHIGELNALLNSPFENLHFYRFYNGTFVYNVTVDFKKREDLELYVNNLLNVSPSIFNVFQLIVNDITSKNTETIPEKIENHK